MNTMLVTMITVMNICPTPGLFLDLDDLPDTWSLLPNMYFSILVNMIIIMIMVITITIMIIIIFRGWGAIDGDGDHFCFDPLHILPFWHLWFETGQRAWVLNKLSFYQTRCLAIIQYSTNSELLQLRYWHKLMSYKLCHSWLTISDTFWVSFGSNISKYVISRHKLTMKEFQEYFEAARQLPPQVKYNSHYTYTCRICTCCIYVLVVYDQITSKWNSCTEKHQQVII